MILAAPASAQKDAKPLPPRAGWPVHFPPLGGGYAKTFTLPLISKDDKNVYSQKVYYDWTGGRLEKFSVTLLRDAKVVGDLKKARAGDKEAKVGKFAGVLRDKLLVLFLDDDKAFQLHMEEGEFGPLEPLEAAAKFDLGDCGRALAAPPRTDFRHTLDEFKALKKGMPYGQVLDWVGQPIRDIGSGLMIFVYPLDDGVQVLLGFPGPTELRYVLVKDKDGKTTPLVE